MSSPRCSIVICTYNRPEMLARCLSSLKQEHDPDALEFLVIDNSADGNAAVVVEEIRDHTTPVRYVHEPVQGLGRARNRGVDEARGEVVFFLDDDAWVEPGFVTRLAETAGMSDFDAFGAYVNGQLPDGTAGWVRADYYHPEPFLESRGILRSGYLHGGASGYRKEVLEMVGGFNEELGMSGLSIGYGEDLELEKRMRARGLRIGYDPGLVVYHEVRYNTVSSILKSHYLRYRSFYMIHDEVLVNHVTRSLASCLYGSMKAFIRGAVMLVRKKNYRLRNVLVETMFPLLKSMAILEVGGPQYLNSNRIEFRRDEDALTTIIRHSDLKMESMRFVEVGGCDGRSFDPVHRFITEYNWQGVIVEPLPHLVKELSEHYYDHNGVRIAPLAITDQSGQAEITYVDPQSTTDTEWVIGLGSLYPQRNALNPAYSRNQQWKDDIKTTSVFTRTWQDFMTLYNPGELDLLVLDVEGAEYSILNQINDLPPLVVFEFSNLPPGELKALKDRFRHENGGYFLVRFTGNDMLAIRKDRLSRIARLRLNLPLN